MSEKKDKELASFEDRLKRLEQISDQIRTGEVELEKAASLFEEGILLSKSLEKELNSVEGRIEKLVKAPTQPGEKPVLELFPELNEQG